MPRVHRTSCILSIYTRYTSRVDHDLSDPRRSYRSAGWDGVLVCHGYPTDQIVKTCTDHTGCTGSEYDVLAGTNPGTRMHGNMMTTGIGYIIYQVYVQQQQ